MAKKNVAVVGIGRVGLPLAIFLANNNYKVFGIGKTQAKIDILNQGKIPFMEKRAAIQGVSSIKMNDLNHFYFNNQLYSIWQKNPFVKRDSTKWPPIKPVPPVTRTCLFFQKLVIEEYD